MLVVKPDGMSQEQTAISRAFGACAASAVLLLAEGVVGVSVIRWVERLRGAGVQDQRLPLGVWRGRCLLGCGRPPRQLPALVAAYQ